MEKAVYIVTVVIAFMVMLFAGVYLAGSDTNEPMPARPAPTTSSSTITTSTSSTSTTTTITTSSTTSTTTTTLPVISNLDLVKVDWFNPKKCRHTVIGNMNTILAEVPQGKVEGTWGAIPAGNFLYSCEGGPKIPVDKIVYRGGGSVEPQQSISGEYRLSIRCGRNSQMEELIDCESLDIYLDTDGLNVTSFGGLEIDAEFVASLPTQPTTTTLKNNPYLDKFRGKGYRKVDMHIAYLCPSCVPAVIQGITYEPGVKSKSLSFKQNISYVIYAPEIVDVERIMELAGAGGDVVFYDDYEFI